MSLDRRTAHSFTPDRPDRATRNMSTNRWMKLLALMLACAGCSGTSPDSDHVWGSGQASLDVRQDGATLLILADGGCYGSYASIDVHGSIPGGAFSLTGTYSQLTGVFPGHADSPATFTGTQDPLVLTLTIRLQDADRTIGPYRLTRGVHTTWPACLYP